MTEISRTRKTKLTPAQAPTCALREPLFFQNGFIVAICLPGILQKMFPGPKEQLVSSSAENVRFQESKHGKVLVVRIVHHKPHKVDKNISIGGGNLARIFPQIQIQIVTESMPFAFSVPPQVRQSSFAFFSYIESRAKLRDSGTKATSTTSENEMQESDLSRTVVEGGPHDKELSLSDLMASPVRVDKPQKVAPPTLLPNRPHQALEYPPLYFLLKRFPRLMEVSKQWYVYRWRASYPLQQKLPCSRALRKLGVHLTWGEAILLLPFWTALASAIIYTFVFPSVIYTGHVARTALIGCFAFAQRNSLITALVGMPIDRTLYYHKLSGRIALIGTIGHAWAFYIDPRYQASNATIRAKLASSFVGSVNTAGSVMALILFLIIMSSLPLVRRRVFELFYYMHIICASGIAMGAFFHTGILIPLLVACTWGVDLFFRSIVMARHRYPTKAKIRTLSATVIELSFPKVEGFDYNPGQYIYLCLPELSYLEWHPFSISSAPKMKNVTLHIRRSGNWTSSLYKLAEQGKEVDILIEGPYGNLGVDVFGDRYKMVILFSGGIGSK